MFVMTLLAGCAGAGGDASDPSDEPNDQQNPENPDNEQNPQNPQNPQEPAVNQAPQLSSPIASQTIFDDETITVDLPTLLTTQMVMC